MRHPWIQIDVWSSGLERVPQHFRDEYVQVRSGSLNCHLARRPIQTPDASAIQYILSDIDEWLLCNKQMGSQHYHVLRFRAMIRQSKFLNRLSICHLIGDIVS